MNASWKPQAVKPRFMSQKPRWPAASRSAAARPGAGIEAESAGGLVSRVSRSGHARGRSMAIAAARASKAPPHPARTIADCATGTRANCPKPPSAPARPIAQLRRSGGNRRFRAP